MRKVWCVASHEASVSQILPTTMTTPHSTLESGSYEIQVVLKLTMGTVIAVNCFLYQPIK